MTPSSRIGHKTLPESPLRRFGVLAVVLTAACLALACGPASPPPSHSLWTAQQQTTVIAEGWGQAVRLDEERLLPAPESTDHEVFRAVVWSPQEGASLRIQGAGVDEVVSLAAEPRPLEIEWTGSAMADGITLQPEGEVFLLWPRWAARERRGETILLAVADTLRHDHANLERMPGVSAYFADGLRFEKAFSAASWTLPSIASLFTGQRPAALRSPNGSLISLPPQHPTLATRMQEQGFATVGITANYTVNHENGFSSGFDAFLAPTPEGHAANFRDASWVVRWARDYAQWLSDLDLFLYLQLVDPHDPYRLHDSESEALPAPQTGHQPSAGEVEDLRRAYAHEVAYLDAQLAPLLQDLDAELTVFTSDHGEEFFDHGGFRHGPTLYPESVQVPLWVRGRGIPTGVRKEPVSLIDLHEALAGDRTVLSDPEASWARSPVAMETFSFGPPRWSWVDGSRQWILWAEGLQAPEPSAPVARWLQQHHPRLQALDLGSGQALPDAVATQQVFRRLMEHFQGYRRGVFVQLPANRELRLEFSGIEGSGWLWGLGTAHLKAATHPEATAHPEAKETGVWLLEATGGEPLSVIFLPSEGEQEPQLWTSPESQPIVLGEDAVSLEGGVRVWLDPGRPPDSLRGTEETLERLKALGYI